MTRLAVVLIVAVVWVLLWGDAAPGTALAGLVIGLVTALVATPAPPRIAAGRLRPLALLRFVGTVVARLIVSSAQVAWEVLTPADRSAPGVVRVHVGALPDAVETLVVLGTNLTPGTLVLRVDGGVLVVHVLHLHDETAVRDDIVTLVALASAAVGADRAAQAEVTDGAG